MLRHRALRVYRPAGHQAIRPSGHRAIGPSGQQAIGPSGQQAIGPTGHQAIKAIGRGGAPSGVRPASGRLRMSSTADLRRHRRGAMSAAARVRPAFGVRLPIPAQSSHDVDSSGRRLPFLQRRLKESKLPPGEPGTSTRKARHGATPRSSNTRARQVPFLSARLIGRETFQSLQASGVLSCRDQTATKWPAFDTWCF